MAKPQTKVKKVKLKQRQYDALIKRLNDSNKINIKIKEYIIQILNNLDEKAAGQRNPEFYYEQNSGITIQKARKRYILRNDSGDVLLSTEDRKRVEEMIYYIC